MKVIEQNILSTKHLLTTFSEIIEFNSAFYKFFSIIFGEINPRVNNNEDVPNITDYAIWIDPNDLEKVEELDDDSLFNSCLKHGRFYIQNLENPEESPILIQAEGEKEIYISNFFMETRKANHGYVPFKLLNDDDKLFEVSVENRELTKPLYDLMALLNKDKPDDFDETINNVSQRFLDLLIETGIEANVSAAEMITNRLIRSVKHPYERPDFTKDELEPYMIYPIYRALEKNKSASVGLSFQNIKRQLLSDTMFEDRTAPAFTDDFFKPIIYTDKLKKYRQLAREAKAQNLL